MAETFRYPGDIENQSLRLNTAGFGASLIEGMKDSRKATREVADSLGKNHSDTFNVLLPVGHRDVGDVMHMAQVFRAMAVDSQEYHGNKHEYSEAAEKGLKVYAVTNNPDQVEQLQGLDLSGIKVTVQPCLADIANGDFGDIDTGTIDIAFLDTILHKCPNLGKLMGALHKVMGPAGLVFFRELLVNGGSRKEPLLHGEDLSPANRASYDRVVYKGGFEDIARDVGFSSPRFYDTARPISATIGGIDHGAFGALPGVDYPVRKVRERVGHVLNNIPFVSIWHGKKNP